ncbi:MAG: hypothetical protein E1N59_46 [Puniceicoccaceae bacterium 5H]|nr:MAG: hypothetical protein E1N59_46 [Puniceicoccaceae bacterium 5H]
MPLEAIQQQAATRVCIPGKVGGELAQGLLDGQPALVTLLASSETHATVATAHEARGFSVKVQSGEEAVTHKATAALERFLQAYGLTTTSVNLAVQLERQTHPGKGLATSSADATALIRVVAQHLGLPYSAQGLYATLCQVERSDYLLSPQRLHLAYPRAGRLENLQVSVPRGIFLSFDTAPGETVDTEAADALDAQRAAFAEDYRRIFDDIASGEPERMAAASLRNAEISLEVLPNKPSFAEVIDFCRENGLGLTCASSGTYAAVLIWEAALQRGSLLRELKREITQRYDSFTTGTLGEWSAEDRARYEQLL